MSIGQDLENALVLIRDQLNSDPLVAAAVSSVISPEGRQLLANVVSSLADLEARHEASKAAAVEAAHAQGVADAQQAVALEDSTS